MMPSQSNTSAFSKLGAAAKAVHDKVRGKPIEAGMARLPDGIENGVAQLVAIQFGTYKDGPNKGQTFFMARGVVKEPKEHNGLTIAGRQTQIGPEPLCATPTAMGKRKTFEDHYGWMINQIGLLAGVKPGETFDIAFEDVEPTCQALVRESQESGVFFAFRTWKGSKQTTGAFAGREPRVQEEWQGRCEYSGTVDPGAGVSSEPSANGAPEAPEPFNEFDNPTEQEQTEVQEELTDWTAWAAAADDQSDPSYGEACDLLTARCGELGIDAAAQNTWADAAQLILEAEGRAEPAPETEPPPPPPAPKAAPKPAAKPPAKPAPKAAAKPAPKAPAKAPPKKSPGKK